MDHSGEALPVHLFAEQGRRVGVGIARVDDDRQAGPLRRVAVAAETVLLPHAVALVVIIIEPGLADTDYARVHGTFDPLRGLDVGMMIAAVRMDTDASPDLRVRLSSGKHPVPLHSIGPASSRETVL